MARLLGRYQVPWARHLRSGKRGCGECEMGHRYGRDRRIPKRREQREVQVIIGEEARPAVFFDERDLAVIGMYEEAGELAGECRHGCSGSPSCTGPECTFMCHRDVR